MRKVLIATCMMLTAFFFGCKKVEYGTIARCKLCNAEISNNVTSKTVPAWDNTAYQVKVDTSHYCEKCGNEDVWVVREYVCEYCGTVYKSDRFQAKRREDRHDERIKQGFCSEQCLNYQKIKEVKEKAGQALDDAKTNTGKALETIGHWLQH
jgi:hypothetical protein